MKILLYYTPYDPKDVNDKKHAWVERIGDECRANDIPFFLEFVGYEEGADEKGLDYAKKKPQIVTESMREFSKDRYGVDVLKVEVPVNMKFVEGSLDSAEGQFDLVIGIFFLHHLSDAMLEAAPSHPAANPR